MEPPVAKKITTVSTGQDEAPDLGALSGRVEDRKAAVAERLRAFSTWVRCAPEEGKVEKVGQWALVLDCLEIQRGAVKWLRDQGPRARRATGRLQRIVRATGSGFVDDLRI